MAHSQLFAQSDFYKDKTIRVIIGYSAGRTNDLSGDKLEALARKVTIQPPEVMGRMNAILGNGPRPPAQI